MRKLDCSCKWLKEENQEILLLIFVCVCVCLLFFHKPLVTNIPDNPGASVRVLFMYNL